MSESTAIIAKAPSKTAWILRGVLIGLILGPLISVIPICGIRRTSQVVLSDPLQIILYAEWTIVCAITCGALLPKLVIGDPLVTEFPPSKNRIQVLYKQLVMPFSATLFLLLYFSASALCLRVNLGVIPTDLSPTFRYAGLVIASAGLLMQATNLLKSSFTTDSGAIKENYLTSKFLNLRHPCFFASMLALTGVPLVLGTWYPLFALPGIFIVLKWIVTEQERTLFDKYGEDYERLQSKSFRLLPYIY